MTSVDEAEFHAKFRRDVWKASKSGAPPMRTLRYVDYLKTKDDRPSDPAALAMFGAGLGVAMGLKGHAPVLYMGEMWYDEPIVTADDCECPGIPDYSDYIEEAWSLVNENSDLLAGLPETLAKCFWQRWHVIGGMRVRLSPSRYWAMYNNAPGSMTEGRGGFYPWVQWPSWDVPTWAKGTLPFAPILIACDLYSAVCQMVEYDVAGLSHSSQEYADALSRLARTMVHEVLHACEIRHGSPEEAFVETLVDDFAKRARCSCYTAASFTGNGTCYCDPPTEVTCEWNAEAGLCRCTGNCPQEGMCNDGHAVFVAWPPPC